MLRREKAYALCIANRGAEDLEVRKVYRVLRDKNAATTSYTRVIDDSGEDYLYPSAYFVARRIAGEGEACVDWDT